VIVQLIAMAMLAVSTSSSRCVLHQPFDSTANATVIDEFRAPACERCAGNRGIEFSLRQGSSLFSASDGVVSFSGRVGQVEYLVIATNFNRRITYGRIESSVVRVGDRVRAGQRVAVSTNSFYFGVREVDGAQVRYVDPNRYLDTSATFAKTVLVRDENAFHGGRSERSSRTALANAC